MFIEEHQTDLLRFDYYVSNMLCSMEHRIFYYNSSHRFGQSAAKYKRTPCCSTVIEYRWQRDCDKCARELLVIIARLDYTQI